MKCLQLHRRRRGLRPRLRQVVVAVPLTGTAWLDPVPDHVSLRHHLGEVDRDPGRDRLPVRRRRSSSSWSRSSGRLVEGSERDPRRPARRGRHLLVHPPVGCVRRDRSITGFMFLFVGIMDLMIAFSNRVGLWWLRMISGFICIGLAFWAPVSSASRRTCSSSGSGSSPCSAGSTASSSRSRCAARTRS